MLWMSFPYPVIPMVIIVDAVVVVFDLNIKQKRVIAQALFTVVVLALSVSLVQAAYIRMTSSNEQETAKSSVVLDQAADIYFIVPDRFASPSALEECGLNTSSFVSELESRGFYVRSNALSSDLVQPSGGPLTTTTRTLRFMASALNMGAEVPVHVLYNQASSMVRNHLVGSVLKSSGYTYHHIGDWWQETLSNPAADYNYIYRGYSAIDYLSYNELTTAVADRSWLREANIGALLPVEVLIRTNHERNSYQRETFKEIAGNGEHPKFVFLHVLLPHPPYTWSKEGELQKDNLSIMDCYLEQVQFTEGYLLDLIDSITDTDSIVIIQSDEGIAFTSPGDNEALSNNQWNGVLTAWRVPGVGDEQLRNIPVTGILGYVIDYLKGD